MFLQKNAAILNELDKIFTYDYVKSLKTSNSSVQVYCLSNVREISKYVRQKMDIYINANMFVFNMLL